MWLSFCKSMQAEMSEVREASARSEDNRPDSGISSEIGQMQMEGDSGNPLQIWHGHFWNEVRGHKHLCPKCEDTFATRLSLFTHMKTHQRPASCSSDDESDENNPSCHNAPPKVPHNSPVLKTVMEEEIVSEDSGFQTPDRNELSFGTADTSTPKRGSAILKRHIRRHAIPASHSELVKRITTRSGRKINSKKRED